MPVSVSTQDLLLDQLKVIFPNEKLLVNSRKQSQVRYSEDRHDLELDFWYPNLNICFEFQDSYHYVATWYNHRPVQLVQQRDEKKKEIIAQKNLRLIVVGCWWDGNLESLLSTIHFQCPDVVLHAKVPPVSLNPPFNFFPLFEIPDVGQLTNPSFLLDPAIVAQSDWWLGEKYDGFRCCWHPESRQLYSRQGNELLVHSKLCDHISSFAIDGELWFGRNNFSVTYQLLNRSSENTGWDFLRLIGFETVESDLQQNTFEERYANALVNTTTNSPFMIIANRMRLPNSDQLNNFSQLIIENGGEGVILQKCNASYESGRSQSILKFKMTLQDQEGMVTEISAQEVQLKLPNSTQLTVPMEHVYLSNLVVGDIVTFSCTFSPLTLIPSNPIIYRRQQDTSWQDVMHSYLQEPKILETSTRSTMDSDFATDRKVFENFAKENNFDPLIPENWYKQRTEKLKSSTGVKNVIVRKFENRTSKALMHLFPEIGLEKLRFAIPSRWADPKNRRIFFEKFAKKNGFDPLNPENWYKYPKNKLVATKGARRIIRYHKHSITKSLLDLFPDIGLDKTKLIRSQSIDLTKQRQFFVNYAKENNFNPLVPENWYSRAEDIEKLKFARRILPYHHNSLSSALIYLFPEVKFKQSQFRKESYFQNTSNRRKVFENYALENNFDALVPENWYTQSTKNILLFKGAHAVLKYHNNSVPKALQDLFPESRFDASKRRTILKRMQKNES